MPSRAREDLLSKLGKVEDHEVEAGLQRILIGDLLDSVVGRRADTQAPTHKRFPALTEDDNKAA